MSSDAAGTLLSRLPRSSCIDALAAVSEAVAASAVASASPASAAGGGGGALPPRKERSKSRDMGKRMGGGQKGVWANPGEILQPVASLDKEDPNYDSEAEENVVLVSSQGSPVKKSEPPNLEPDELAAKELAVNPPPEIKKRIIEILDEYLTSGDIDEVKRYGQLSTVSCCGGSCCRWLQRFA